jgi:predicted HTH domain antitoxin
MNSAPNSHTQVNGTHNRRSKEKQVIIDMVKAKVSFPVMAQLTGMSKNKFTQLQRELNIPENENGQHEPQIETNQQLIWSTWNHYDSVDDTYRLLTGYSSTSFKITAILAVIDRMETNTVGIS